MFSKFVPDQIVDTIYDIQLLELYDSGIRAIITDLDNTLVGTREMNSPARLVEWIHRVETAGMKLVIVSNNNEFRVSQFAKLIGVFYISRAQKPRVVAFRKALQELGMEAAETVMLGDQLITDIFGANRMGMHSIWVKPISLHDEKWTTRLLNRRLEAVVLLWMRRKGYLKKGGQR